MDLIIGAGISGLSYANFCNHNDYLIIEKDSEIGGYCKTVKKDGFVWDYSGHFFHFRNDEIKDYLLKEMDRSKILDVEKHTQIYYNKLYIDFPFQKNIHQLPKNEFIECLYDLFINDYKDESNFKKMLYSKFGKSICEKFLIPYNEKIYACDLNLLDVDAMGRFFPYANKEEIIRNFKQKDNTSYNSIFTYPKGGAIEYVNSLYKRVNNEKVALNENLISIDLDKKIAKTTNREIKFDKLISSIPFTSLLQKSGINFDDDIYSWNKVLVFNLGFNKKGKDKLNHWVYFPGKDYLFYRIGYYDNIFNDDRLSLYVEIGFNKTEKVNPDDYLDRVLNDLKKAEIITDHELVAYHSVIMNPAYVHVNKQSDADKRTKMQELTKNNVHSIGRYGDWKYCSIEDNIIEANELAKKIN